MATKKKKNAKHSSNTASRAAKRPAAKQTRNNRTDEEKRKILAGWKASGKDGNVYGVSIGVGSGLLYRWRRQLGDSPPPPVAAPNAAAPPAADGARLVAAPGRHQEMIAKLRLEGLRSAEISERVGRLVTADQIKSALTRVGKKVAEEHGLPWPPVPLKPGPALQPDAPHGRAARVERARRSRGGVPSARLVPSLVDALQHPDESFEIVAYRHGISGSALAQRMASYGPWVAEHHGLALRPNSLVARQSPASGEPTVVSVTPNGAPPPSAALARRPPPSTRAPAFVARPMAPATDSAGADRELDRLKDIALAQALRERDAFRTVFDVMQREQRGEASPESELARLIQSARK